MILLKCNLIYTNILTSKVMVRDLSLVAFCTIAFIWDRLTWPIPSNFESIRCKSFNVTYKREHFEYWGWSFNLRIINYKWIIYLFYLSISIPVKHFESFKHFRISSFHFISIIHFVLFFYSLLIKSLSCQQPMPK